jgi:hypothetical protein
MAFFHYYSTFSRTPNDLIYTPVGTRTPVWESLLYWIHDAYNEKINNWKMLLSTPLFAFES